MRTGGERQIEARVSSWSLHHVVKAIQGPAQRGAHHSRDAGRRDRRLPPLRPTLDSLMGSLGLVPKERSLGLDASSGRHNQGRQQPRPPHDGGISLDLPPAAPHWRRTARAQPRAIFPRRCAPSAGRRRCGSADRYRRMLRAGRPKNVITVAIARELAGFIWAISVQVDPVATPT